MFVFDANTMAMVNPSEGLPQDFPYWPQIRSALEMVFRANRSMTPGEVVVVLLDRDSFSDLHALQTRFDLTRREAEVASLLAQRMSSKEIAARLGISVHTARRHTEQVLAKLGVRSRKDVRQCIWASRQLSLPT